MENTNGCNCNEPLMLTKTQWAAKHRDFKSTRMVDGKRYRSALRACPAHGTCSVTVTLTK